MLPSNPIGGQYLRQGLSEAGFSTDLAADGITGQHLALTGDYSLLILDLIADHERAVPLQAGPRAVFAGVAIAVVVQAQLALERRAGQHVDQQVAGAQLLARADQRRDQCVGDREYRRRQAPGRAAHQRRSAQVPDQALYAAKGAGRNCVIAAGQTRRGAVRMESAAG